MRRLSLLTLVLLLICGVSFSVFAQNAVIGSIKVVGVPSMYQAGNKGMPTTGLQVVGVGTRVVLKPYAVWGTGAKYGDSLLTVTSATWGITPAAGSSATIADTTTSGTGTTIVGFTADKVGLYTITMTATTAKGTSAQVTSTIQAGAWVGAGYSLDSTKAPLGCVCHNTATAPGQNNFTGWQKTNHATALKRKFDGLNTDGSINPASHFADYCMPCHTAGYFGAAPNGGYSDLRAQMGWHVVNPQHVGVYDSLKNASTTNANLKQLMGLMGIQCENCHGPAGNHQNDPSTYKLEVNLSTDVCAPCHTAPPRHGKGWEWQASAHANSLVEGTSPEYMNRPVCARCHTGQGYVLEAIGGQPQPLPATGLKVYDKASNISCAVCHDPHDGSNPSQLRAKSVGDACMGCHITRISSRGLHSAHQGMMLTGVSSASTPFNMSILTAYQSAPSGSAQQNAAAIGNWRGWEFPGYKYENSSHSNIADRCAVCHMAPSPTYDPTYAKKDTLQNVVGGHTFKISNIVVTGADTTEFLNSTGCVSCHGTVSLNFVEATQAKINDLLTTLANALPDRDSIGTPIQFTDTVTNQNWKNGAKRRLTLIERAAAYNRQFVANDLSGGVHNFLYAKGLLTSSIEQLKLGTGAVSGISVKDRPNDNGRYLRVSWQPFPAEKFGFGSVEMYYVFKRVLNPGNAPAAKVSSYSSMIAQAGNGKLFKLNDYFGWASYGPYATTGQIMFADIPTDADSAAYTAVFVGGYSADMSVSYASPVDSFYSVANVKPNIVSGFAAALANGGALLTWNKPTVDDPLNMIGFKYDVFRGTTAGFDISGQTPIASQLTTTQYLDKNFVEGTTYYYKVVAQYKESPLRSDASTEIALKVTGVDETGGIPTEFALKQNYPNPFNPTTEIGFALPKDAHVKISIYNIAGVEVKTLVDGQLSAGNKKVTWNGTSNEGISVASGVYLYRIQAGNFVSTRKMVLIK